MIDQFSRSVANLTGHVRSFGASITNDESTVSAGEVAKCAGSCESALKQLSLCAEQQKVDLNPHYTQLIVITDGLKTAKSSIQQKIERADWDERTALMTSLGSVNAALKTASGLTSKVFTRKKSA
jgi:hypothetical protein